MALTLTVTAGPHVGREFTFTGHDTFLVGRSKQAHFQLPAHDKYFSRLHFLIEINPPQCRLQDMGSHNGTYVNGQRVQSTLLHNGDQIKAGHTIFQVVIDSDATETQLPSPLPPVATASWQQPPREADRDTAATPVPRTVIAAEPLPNIPGYRILRKLGGGGMGVVHLAERETDGRQVAVKTIRPGGDARRTQVERFLREAEILRQLEHPHIVAFHEMGETEGQLFFVMDYVPGKDVGQLLKEHERLPVRFAVTVLCQTLQGLDFAHGKRFVHRDIKPANLLVEQTDMGKRVRVADFGLARVYQSSQLSGLTLSGDIGGTIPYMPPEQITRFRHVNPLSDQYAAAATLYHMLTGQFVYDFATADMQPLLLVLQEEPVPIQKRGVALPTELAEIIHQALAREPKKRYRSAGEFREALLPFAK